MFSSSKGRTLWEILWGKNEVRLTPMEMQYHNPLKAKIGDTVSLEHNPDFKDVHFLIERISVYETKVKYRKFYHTDYHLKGISLDKDHPLRFRLRLIPDENEMNKLGCQIQLLHLYEQMEWDAEFHDNILCDISGEFHVNYGDNGEELPDPRKYWRVEDVLDPYHATVTILSDKDNSGKVDENELEYAKVTYWDYHRLTPDENNQEILEYLTVEMNDESKYFNFLRGTKIDPSQVIAI